MVITILSGKKIKLISCEYAHVHSISLSTTKFHDILLSGLMEL